jgi:hypothetical protein
MGSEGELISVVRTRLISCQKLLGGSLDTYVREVTFVELATEGPPRLVQHSVNLTLRHCLRVKERIAYHPAPQLPDLSTRFEQSAFIEAQGKFAAGEIAAYIGRKIEQHSWERCALFDGDISRLKAVDRFDSNAQIGKEGFLWTLKRMWGESE